ncbi:arginase [Flavihumibacter stibioxidans]|uniref:Arginase n=1 Tax=Flavihumibacter stibioxidans TaxID=1834163 RepID=A0ABR7M3D8_9BACT|nr:arginase [Flavihumibacter stibioxidans]
MPHFKFYNKQDLLYLTRLRRFETKLGERLLVVNDPEQFEEKLSKTTAKYILFGIPEDIGVKANYGRGGADSAWLPFLTAFLNIQSNDFMTGEEILLLGHFDFGDLQYLIENHARSEEEKIDAYRHAVSQIDGEVEALARQIQTAGKIPIAIGGGHNNAYPLIKGSAKGLLKSGRLPLAQINAINLDAHTDFRPAEGRHSGNGFRYAEEDGYLQKYCVIGAQENYIPQNVWVDFVNNPFLDLVTFEDIFLHEKRHFMQAVAHASNFVDDNWCGIELDLDVVENTLSSAVTPSGVTAANARQYLNFVAMDLKPAYLHICEGASQLSDGRKSDNTGKLIAYLVSDFVKARNSVGGLGRTP